MAQQVHAVEVRGLTVRPSTLCTELERVAVVARCRLRRGYGFETHWLLGLGEGGECLGTVYAKRAEASGACGLYPGRRRKARA